MYMENIDASNYRIKSKNSLLLSWGVVLSFFGVSLMAVVKVILGRDNSFVSTLVNCISIILMLDFRNKRLLLLRKSRPVMLIFVYSIVTLLLSILSGIPAFQSPGGFVFQACYFVQIYLIWINADRMNTTQIHSITFHLGGLLSFIMLIAILRQGVAKGIILGAALYSDEGSRIVTRSSTGLIGLISLLSALSYKPTRRLFQYERIIILCLSIVVLVFSNRRTANVAALLILILHLRNGAITVVTRKKMFSALKIAVTVLIIILICWNIPGLHDIFQRSFESLSGGISAFLGRQNGDLSATMRSKAITSITNDYWTQPFLNFMFGNGYMTRWIDVPFLQAFWELGILGGIAFFVIQGICPVLICLRKNSLPEKCFAQYYVAARMITSLASGTCYGAFLPLILYYSFIQTGVKDANFKKTT